MKLRPEGCWRGKCTQHHIAYTVYVIIIIILMNATFYISTGLGSLRFQGFAARQY